MLADLQADSLDWSTYANSGSADVIDYSQEEIWFFTFDTGNPWAADFEGALDAITITLTNGTSVTVDLDVSSDSCKKGGFAALGL